jgi:hypothetical protein
MHDRNKPQTAIPFLDYELEKLLFSVEVIRDIVHLSDVGAAVVATWLVPTGGPARHRQPSEMR